MKRWHLLTGWLLLTTLMYFSAWNRSSLYLIAVASLLLVIMLIGITLPWLAITTTRLTLLPITHENGTGPQPITVRSLNRFFLPHEGLILKLQLLNARNNQPLREISLSLPRLLPGKSQLDLVIPALPRGRYHFTQSSLFASKPFGFHEFQRPIDIDSAMVTVRPHRFSLPTQSWTGGTRQDLMASSPQGRAGGSSEFFGVRQYRPGDSARHIDWKATARQGELIVREFEDIARPELVIGIDCHASSLNDETGRPHFEASIRLAASTAYAALQAGIAVGLESQHFHLTPAHGDLQDWQLLEALTDMQPDSMQTILARLRPLMQPGQPPCCLLLLAFSGNDNWPSLQKAIPLLAASGHLVDLVVAPSKSFKQQELLASLRPHCRRVAIHGTTSEELLLA